MRALAECQYACVCVKRVKHVFMSATTLHIFAYSVACGGERYFGQVWHNREGGSYVDREDSEPPQVVAGALCNRLHIMCVH